MSLKELEQLEVRFSGSGGQGLVLASIIFADVLVAAGYNVIQGESHGIEARGGASRGEIIASKEEITDLAVSEPDIFIAISQKSCDKYYQDIKENALVIIDSFLVTEIPKFKSNNIYLLPFTNKVKEEFDSILPTNIAFLGAMAELSNLVDHQLFIEAIKKRIPTSVIEMNLKAFALGVKMAQAAAKDKE